MSSHHIVRENQEPALFIANPDCLVDEYLNQILEWSPTIITLAEHYESLKAREIKIDVVLDNLGLKPNILEEHITLIPYSGPYIEPLIAYLQEKNNFAVNILTEKLEINPYLPYLGDFNINLIRNEGRALFVKKYEKWLPKGFNLYVEHYEGNLGEGHNLKPLENNVFAVASDGFVSIPQQGSYFIISEEL